MLDGLQRAATIAFNGKLTAVILKQMKGAGVHTVGAKSHNLHPGGHTGQAAHHRGSEASRAAAGGLETGARQFRTRRRRPGGTHLVTESVLELAPSGELPLQEFKVGDKQVPSTAMGALVAAVGKADPRFVVTNADGNEASGMKNINEALKIRHPTADALYNQGPNGQVYEPLSEDACAGLAGGTGAVRLALTVAVL